MTTEIERKWIVSEPPPAETLGPGDELRQGYIARENDVEVRVRITASSTRITVKGGSGLSRTEVELEINDDAGKELWSLTEGRRIEKVRHRVALGAAVAEVDIYDGALAGLVSVEVEFASVDEAGLFVPPAWFGREVTGDSAWSNASLAERGLPSSRGPSPSLRST
ncbi:MAG: CYTH domain-containing protein [Actinobacteria bacterium]|nr:CYTH domain-containing protein [Actinomycetota bacterium]